jgi:hypothetical protein
VCVGIKFYPPHTHTRTSGTIISVLSFGTALYDDHHKNCSSYAAYRAHNKLEEKESCQSGRPIDY